MRRGDTANQVLLRCEKIWTSQVVAHGSLNPHTHEWQDKSLATLTLM